MKIKYEIEIDSHIIKNSLQRLTNQIYKLLPSWEEQINWTKPLTTIIEELAGMSRLLINHQEHFFILLCKLEGLFLYTDKNDFLLFRKTIFECLNLVGELMRNVTE